MDSAKTLTASCAAAYVVAQDDEALVTKALATNDTILVALTTGALHAWAADGSNHRILEGHNGPIWALAHSENLLASGDTEGMIRVWDKKTGASLHLLSGHKETVRVLFFLPDTNVLVSGSRDTTIRVWKINSDVACIHELGQHEATVRCLALANSYLASASDDGVIRLWDIADAFSCAHVLLGHTGAIYSLAYDSQRRLLASAGADGSVRLWSSETGDAVANLERHSGVVNNICLYGGSLVSSDTKGCVCIWSLEHKSLVHSFAAHSTPVITMDIQQQGIVMTGGKSGDVKLWHLETYNLVGELVATRRSTRAVYWLDDKNAAIVTMRNLDVMLEVMQSNAQNDSHPNGLILLSDMVYRNLRVKSGESLLLTNSSDADVADITRLRRISL